jgi:hypothetical protein
MPTKFGFTLVCPKIICGRCPTSSSGIASLRISKLCAARLILKFINACLPDIDDFITLTHCDSHYGAQKILRSLYERTVTLKYIAANPSAAEKFVSFDAIDWDQVLWGLRSYLA